MRLSLIEFHEAVLCFIYEYGILVPAETSELRAGFGSESISTMRSYPLFLISVRVKSKFSLILF